jgi:hypothetical protein
MLYLLFFKWLIKIGYFVLSAKWLSGDYILYKLMTYCLIVEHSYFAMFIPYQYNNIIIFVFYYNCNYNYVQLAANKYYRCIDD